MPLFYFSRKPMNKKTGRKVAVEPFPGILTKQVVDRLFTTKCGKTGCQHIHAWVLTAEQEAWLRKWYPITENKILMELSGMTHGKLHRLAREMGLSKSATGIKRIRKRQAAHIKRVCESNGYYASIRGKAPSEATLQGVRRLWQDVREGKREHPAQIMKRQNPRRYRKWLENKSASRKAQMRKELLRLQYGLKRETNLPGVVLVPYTKRQVDHRYHALKRGYIVAEDCSEQSGDRYNIFYDQATTRSARFEQNLKADGFHILPWD